jgi:hypothetical protein
MAKRKQYDDKLFLDMPFGEALGRFASVDPKEMHANIKAAKKKKPPGGKKPPSDGRVQDVNVVRLRDRRKRKNLG